MTRDLDRTSALAESSLTAAPVAAPSITASAVDESQAKGWMSFTRGSEWRMLLAVLLLLVIAWSIDLEAAFSLFGQTDWRWILLCLVIVQLQVVLSAKRWQVTAVRLGLVLNVPRAVREYYLATLGNLSLPGGISGDAARIYRARRVAGVRRAAQSVMIERLAGQVALIVVTLAGWICWPWVMHGSAPSMGMELLLSTLMLLVVFGLLLGLVRRFAAGRVLHFMTSFGPALHRAWWGDRQWLVQGVLSLGIVATYLAVFAACALALQQPLPVAAVISIVPLVLLSMVIPLSIGGWGIREAVAASLWPVAGLSPEAGVATSILYGLVSTLGSVPGAVWAGLTARER